MKREEMLQQARDKESMSALKATYEMRTIAYEDKMLSYLNNKMEHLDKEFEVKKKLGFKKLNPDYEYENAPEFHAHMLETLRINVEEEKIKVQSLIDKILNQRDERKLISEMKN
jgi:hypothetical protein